MSRSAVEQRVFFVDAPFSARQFRGWTSDGEIAACLL
jgi:hypothetical protein